MRRHRLPLSSELVFQNKYPISVRIYIVLHYFKNITQLCKHNMAQMRALWICFLCYYEKQTETVMINHSTNINKANSHLSSSLIEHQQSEQSPLIITHRTSTKRTVTSHRHSQNINKANSHLSSSLTEHQQSEQSPLIITHRTSTKRTVTSLHHSQNIKKANSHLSSSLTEHQQSEQSPLIITHRTSTKRTVTSHHHSQNIKKDHVIWRWKSSSWSGTCPSGGV